MMNGGRPVTVYFTCQDCGSTYTAMQEHRSTRQAGRFICVDCGARVYDWAGSYEYSDWKPYLMRLSHMGKQLG
jgi:hypothetical protein